MIKKSTKALT